MTANYTPEHVRENAHISIPITTSNNGDSLAVPVSNVINQFGLGSKTVYITCDGRTNLAICKAILESIFEHTGFFELGNTVFVMKCFAYVLSNACKSGVMYVQYDYGRVNSEVTRRDIQHCITWTKNHKRGKGFGDSAEACETSL